MARCVGVPEMLSYFTDFDQYMPHGMCLLWQPWLLLLWAGSDLLILAAYFAIPFALLRVLAKRKDIRQRGLVVLFASFIMLCGITHGLSVVTLWVPIYPLVGMVKLATGIVSAITAVVLFRLIPTLISLPSLQNMQDANANLRAEVESHTATMETLRQTRDALELTVAERTAELKDLNAKLSIAAREAIHRSHNLIAVVTSMARQSSRMQTDVGAFTEVLIGRLSALADATGAIVGGQHESTANLHDVVTRQLAPVMQTYADKVTVTGPELQIDAEAAQQISLAIHELATNAQKHGSLAAEDGRIAVSYAVTDAVDPDAARVVLVWHEDTGTAQATPMPVGPRQGFGTRLLMQIVPTMLDGTSSRSVQDGQMTYTLDVPLSALMPNMAQTRNEAFVAGMLDGNFGDD